MNDSDVKDPQRQDSGKSNSLPTDADKDNWRKKPGRFVPVLSETVRLSRIGGRSVPRWVFKPNDGSGTVEVSSEDVPDIVKDATFINGMPENVLEAYRLLFQWAQEWLDTPEGRRWSAEWEERHAVPRASAHRSPDDQQQSD